MRSVPVSCVSILVVFGLCQGITARKPTIIPTTEELVIQEGDELRIQCQGEGRLKFATQDNTNHISQSKFNIFTDEKSGTYTFIRNGTKAEDTGWYACAEESVEIKNDEKVIDHKSDDIAWIYVYVNSSVPFAIDANYALLTAVAGGRFVVPCRPTSPDLPVKLEINWGNTKVPTNTTYDPKIGFIISEVGRELSGHNFECQLDAPHATETPENIQWPTYSLHVADSAPLQKPRINQDQIRHVVWGRDLIVDCEVTVPTTTMCNMSWKVPASVPKDRWSYTPEPIPVSHASNSPSTCRTELIVKNIEETDEGKYVCVVVHLSESVESSADIKIWDPNYTYINASVEGSHGITVHREDKEARWKIHIDTYPENVTWIWYKPNEHEIVINGPDKNSKYSYSREGMYHFFSISKIDVEDNGNYTIRLSTVNDEKIINLQLTVLAEPSVLMDKVLPFYSTGESATFTCRTSGMPLPNITWIIKEYADFIYRENPELKYPSKVTSKLGEKGPYHLVSTLDAKINQTGDVTCRFCNEINCVESTAHVFVSDVAGRFGIIDPGLVTEGDDINLTCGASVYNFTDTITWRSEVPKTQEFNTSRIHPTQRKSNFTSQSILEIRNVSKSDAGKYICEAVTTGGSTEKKEYQLIVNAALAPRFINNTMEDSEIVLDLKNETARSMIKVCFAEGMPIPQVYWYKNDQLLVESSQYKFSENNCKLHIAYFLDGDSGRYACKATNRIGTAERYMDIKIAAKSQSHTLLIGLISVFVVLIMTVIAYMGIRLHREKRLRQELLNEVSVKFEDGGVRCSNRVSTVDEQLDLLPDDRRSEFLRKQYLSSTG